MTLPPVLHHRHLLTLALGLSALSTLSACGKRAPKAQTLPSGSTVLALGDSLTQGVGASAAQAWPRLLEEDSGWEVINAGISGNTSAQALARLPQLLDAHRPALVIVSIGGNDFLRQESATTTRDHIRQIAQQAQDSGAEVVLVAVPRFSLLAASTGRMSDHPLYEELAQELRLPLYADGWSEVLSDPSLRSDQIHANAQGYAQFAQGLMAFLRQRGWLI